MRISSRGLGFIAGTLLAASVAAQQTPDSLPGVQLVGAHDVVRMAQARDAVIVDTRTKNEYAEAHIKGARNIPYQEKSAKRADFDPAHDRFDLTKLPQDKAAAVVFYCNAGECWKSYKASKAAVNAGYHNVHWFRGGLPDWKANALPVE